MDTVLADKILRTLADSYPGIGSKSLAEKVGVSEIEVVNCLYQIKAADYGLFTISSGIDGSTKDLQPMMPAITALLDDGGFSKTLKAKNVSLPEDEDSLEKKTFLNSEIKHENFRVKLLIFIAIVLIAVIAFIVWWAR